MALNLHAQFHFIIEELMPSVIEGRFLIARLNSSINFFLSDCLIQIESQIKPFPLALR